MFSDHNRTVFILGAGASWHYGYPTGEDLVRKVLEKARIVRSFCGAASRSLEDSAVVHLPKYLLDACPTVTPAGGLNEIRARWAGGYQECEDFISRLSSVDPLVIDYFLGLNPPMRNLGKLLITWVLLECEARYRTENGNINRRDALYRSPAETDRQRAQGLDLRFYDDNWYRFLVHKLVTNCTDSRSLLSNNVKFVTFNYDVSLEYHLFRALSSLSQFEDTDLSEFFHSDHRFIHIYGKIRADPFADPPLITFPSASAVQPRPNPLGHEEIRIFQNYKSALDLIYEASTGLRTIAPHEKVITEDVDAAREVLRDANCVYILGYGFDENNCSLLDLSTNLKLASGSGKVVLFTNFRNSNLINKNASRVFFGRNDQLLSADYVIVGTATTDYLLERSIRDVYGALALDFDAPEEHFIKSSSRIW